MPYQTITAIAITLLAVTIPIFTFATTLLGTAIEEKKRKESRLTEAQQKHVEREINEITATKENGNPSQSPERFDVLQTKLKNLSRERKSLGKRYSLLTSKQSILYPGAWFVGAIVLNEVAKIINEKELLTVDMSVFKFPLSPSLVLLAMICIVVGSRRICKCLTLIQKVATTAQLPKIRPLLPIGAAPSAVLEWLDVQHIKHSGYQQTDRTIQAIIRDVSRYWPISESGTLQFTFDEHNRLASLVVKPMSAGS